MSGCSSSLHSRRQLKEKNYVAFKDTLPPTPPPPQTVVQFKSLFCANKKQVHQHFACWSSNQKPSLASVLQLFASLAYTNE